ncbi:MULTISPECIES: CU044_2847 family protein [unclassified Streptomyces]|uniref:CU044_2847 family protein n=1 Tax=unclassified Streptomyces TaxID=2593676 RepID=UPI0009A0FF28|nr:MULTISPECIES: CU044_2847 family protein [unclassified Streptomyces]
MAQLITMAVDEDGERTAVFEVDDGLGLPLPERVPAEGPVARGQASLQEALERLQPALSEVTRSVRRLGPDRMEIEFGLKMGGETGVIVARGTAEVNFAVRLVWDRA